MKVLTLIKNDVCYAAYEDTAFVFMYNDKIVTKSPDILIWTGVNNSNSLLFDNVTLPVDWEPYKYSFNGFEWSLNPEWTAPEPEPEI